MKTFASLPAIISKQIFPSRPMPVVFHVRIGFVAMTQPLGLKEASTQTTECLSDESLRPSCVGDDRPAMRCKWRYWNTCSA